ncbi:efflux RND transporter permease subunit, partial [Novosphingobium panipatense]
QAQDNGVMVTARFLVGSNPEDAAIRIEEKLRANWDRKPVGIPDPMVTVRGINDVPTVVLTLTPKPGAAGQWNDASLYELASKLRTEIAKVDDVGITFLVGGRPEEIRIAPDPAKLRQYGVPLGSVIEAASQANRSFPLGNIREDGKAVGVTAGRTLSSAQEVGLLTVRSGTGSPVYLRDVAAVTQGPRENRPAHGAGQSRTMGRRTAVG